MKFRRHVPERGSRKRWLSQLTGVVRRLVHLPSLGKVGMFSVGHRGWVWIVGTLGSFAVGYILAVLVLFPAPIFAATIVVPRVLGLEQEEAEVTVQQMGLTLGDVRAESHPSATRGTVVWQDPPPEVAVPRGHMVQLTVSGGPQRVPVPDLTGYDATLAEQMILASGLIVGRTEATQAPAPRGVVINSRPPAGATLIPGTEVTLVVSVGAPTITVPNLAGLTREAADSVLIDAGLVLGTSIRRTTSEGSPGTVIEQMPAPGTLSAPGTAVNVTLARERDP